MRACVIENGVVTNVVMVDALDVFPDVELIDGEGGGNIGDSWDGTQFTPAPTPVPPPAPVPQSVTMRQARLALLQRGLLDQVDTVIAAITDPATQRAAQIEWEFSNEVHRAQPLVLMLGPELGLDAAGLDDLFVYASGL